MDYTVFTNDTNHTAAILDALSDNVGDNYDFVPYSQQNWEANDDQVYWLYSALTGMEYNFTALPCVGEGTGANGTVNTLLYCPYFGICLLPRSGFPNRLSAPLPHKAFCRRLRGGEDQEFS